MKNYIYLMMFSLLIASTSCEEDELPPIQSFTASEGTYIKVIRLAIEEVEGAEAYNIQRRNPQTYQWEDVHWGGSFYLDDTGWNLPDNQFQAGEIYEYRARTHKNGPGYGEWSDIVTGYIFSPSPKLASIEYTKDSYFNSYNVTFNITDELPSKLYNLLKRQVSVIRSEYMDFHSGINTWHGQTFPKEYMDSEIIWTESTYNYDPAKNYYYKLEVRYFFDYYPFYDNVLHHIVDEQYVYESSVIEGKDITTSDPAIGTTSYNVHNYGEINSSATGAKHGTMMCADGSNVYLGYFDTYSTLAGYGKPVIMKNSGSGWVNVGGTMPSELSGDEDIYEFDYTVSGGVIYLTALAEDTIYVFKNDGIWSENFSSSVLLEGSRTGLLNIADISYANIAVYNHELYLTLMIKDDVKVFKYQGSDWVQVGSTVASGFITNTKLKNIDGTLYIWYESHVENGSVTTLHIKHLAGGSSWVNDLEWSKENADNFDLIKANGSLYFKYDIMNVTGDVCKVVSTTNVEGLVEEIQGMLAPQSITADASGNIIISVITGTSAYDIHQEVYVYENSTWKKIEDDYSDTSIRGMLSSVQAINNDIHFVYGVEASEDVWNIPTILKAKKYNK